MQNAPRLELTFKAVFIGLVLAIVFCGANVYLGLKIGNTISASIPASIIAMIFLRLFKNYSVLENSISQTIATTGEGAAATVIFIFPAMLILGQWQQFDYWNMVFVGITGGFIGIIYSVILRGVLLKDKDLVFPEGQATGKVLLTMAHNSDANKKSSKILMLGMFISSILNVCQVGLQVLAGSYYKIVKVGASGIIGVGTSFSAAIIGAGFLVGFGPTVVGFIALLIGWLVLLPIFTNLYGIHDAQNIVDSAFYTWQHYIRPIGIGVLIFSGLSTILMLSVPIWHGIQDSIRALKNIKSIAHHERDLNIKKLMLLFMAASMPVVIYVFYQFSHITQFSAASNLILAFLVTVFVLFIGFVTAAVAGYFAGLVGSTNSPVSGLLYISVIAISLILILLVDHKNVAGNNLLVTLVTLVGFAGFTAIITGTNIQDYKSGQIVGSTPYRLQIALFIGIVLSVFVVPLFMNLIFNAYGIAGIVPHAGIDPHQTLSAPQASAVALLATNILNMHQDWSLIVYGLLIGFVVLIFDIIGKKTGKFRCNVLSFGIGLYLPPDLVTALFIGGFLRLIIDRKQAKISQIYGKSVADELHTKGSLLVCGLVAGESLMGLILSIPFVIFQSSNALKVVNEGFIASGEILSLVVTICLFCYIYKIATKTVDIKAK